MRLSVSLSGESLKENRRGYEDFIYAPVSVHFYDIMSVHFPDPGHGSGNGRYGKDGYPQGGFDE